MFKRMKIGIRLWLLVLVVVTALLAMAGEALLILRHTMLEDRQINARNAVETAYGVVAHYGDLVLAHKQDPESAQAQAQTILRELSYQSKEYFWVSTVDLRMVMHPAKPELVGRDLSKLKDPNGKLVFIEFADVAKRSGGGFVDYYWPEPGSDDPIAKISYVKLYDPWGWVIGSGVYVDDVDRAFKNEIAKFSGFALLTLLVIGLVGSGIKVAGDALYRMNRELRAITNCSQVLVRAADEQTLLDSVCRIICDEAGYRGALVAYIENDDIKSLRPAAWAGLDSGHIANAKISLADDQECGQGRAGKAVRSGETIYSPDIAADPQMAHWCDNALPHGCRSAIALPLKDASGGIFGVLLICTTEINAIAKEERRLLEELADDLAYGIVALRTRVENKRAEEALKESNANYRRIVETASEGIWLIDHDIKTVFVNAHMAEMLGYSCEELIGRSFTDFLFEEDVPDHDLRIEHRRHGKAENYERRFRCKDGHTLWTLASATPIFDDANRFIGSFAMFTDITERKRAEEALRKRNEELERFERLVVGRELTMVELKKRITQLNEALASGKEKDHES